MGERLTASEIKKREQEVFNSKALESSNQDMIVLVTGNNPSAHLLKALKIIESIPLTSNHKPKD